MKLNLKHMNGNKSRQLFMAIVALFILSANGFSQVGKRFPSEKTTMKDKITGKTITVLTTSPGDDSKIYQTHPQWTYDGKYIIFTSNRDTSYKRSKVYAVDVKAGTIIQLTEGETPAGSLNISRLSNKLYYSSGGRGAPLKLVEMDLEAVFKDSEKGITKKQSAYERTVGTLPDNLRESGGFTLDANEKFAYVGVGRVDAMPKPDPAQKTLAVEPIPGGIRAINIATGEVTTVIDVPYRMGHIQANPFKTGEILFCHESGGDTPQRMWMVNADGTGYKAVYKERPDEWVSHETWVDANTIYFNVKPSTFYTKLTPNVADFRALGEGVFTANTFTMPTGIFAINIRTDNVKVLGSVDKGHGYWHSNGTQNGKWAMGDNFDGDLYLINLRTGEQSLLTTGNLMVFKGAPDHDLFHPHATFRPDGKQLFYQSGAYSGGKNYDLMLVDVPGSN
jgi:oligogalacturonide lyase